MKKKICDKDVYCDNCRLQVGKDKRCYYVFLEDLKLHKEYFRKQGGCR